MAPWWGQHTPQERSHPEVGVHGLIAATAISQGRVALRLFGVTGGAWPVQGRGWRPPPRVGPRGLATASWSFSRCAECGVSPRSLYHS
eukprot:10614823-Alexandrium_andersonii.AAC.1